MKMTIDKDEIERFVRERIKYQQHNRRITLLIYGSLLVLCGIILAVLSDSIFFRTSLILFSCCMSIIIVLPENEESVEEEIKSYIKMSHSLIQRHIKEGFIKCECDCKSSGNCCGGSCG